MCLKLANNPLYQVKKAGAFFSETTCTIQTNMLKKSSYRVEQMYSESIIIPSQTLIAFVLLKLVCGIAERVRVESAHYMN